MKAVMTRGLTFSYPMRSEKVIQGLNLSIDVGELMFIVGDSGSGKSTLLKILSGIAPFTTGGTLSGEVRVLGEDIKREEGRGRVLKKVFYLNQEPEYYLIFSTVISEAATPYLESCGSWSAAERKGMETIQKWLKGVKPHTKVSHLSGGEKQRMALSHMEASDAKLYLLDEPLTHLDEEGRRRFYLLLRKKLDEGATVLITTPSLFGYDKLKEMANKIYFMNRKGVEKGASVMGGRTAVKWEELGRGRIRREGATKPLLTVKNAVVSLGGKRVINGLNLTLGKGEVFIARGENGSGKTTLIRLLLGFVVPEEGKVSAPWLNEKGEWMGSQKLIVGYLPQNPMDIFTSEDLASDLFLSWRTGKRRERFKSALKRFSTLFRLEGLEGEDPYELSTGERQRAALASVFIRYPDVVFLDEPTRGMDGRALITLTNLIGQMKGESTIFISTHTTLFEHLSDKTITLPAVDEWEREGGGVCG